MPRGVKRADLVHALKESIGRIDEAGNEIVGADEVTDPKVLADAKRPGREKIKRLAREMAENEARKVSLRRNQI